MCTSVAPDVHFLLLRSCAGSPQMALLVRTPVTVLMTFCACALLATVRASYSYKEVNGTQFQCKFERVSQFIICEQRTGIWSKMGDGSSTLILKCKAWSTRETSHFCRETDNSKESERNWTAVPVAK